MSFWACLIKIEAFCTKNEDFDQTYVNTGLKTQNVEKLSLDMIYSIIFARKIAKVLVTELQVNISL